MSWYYIGYGVDPHQCDYITFHESTGTNKPKISFSYSTTNYWALIIGADGESRFTHDALNMYNTLIDHYNFTAESIYLLAANATDPISGDPVPRDRTTSVTNIEWAIDQIEERVGTDGQVVVWITGHGETDEYYTIPPTQYITASQLDTALDDISCGELFLYLGQCKSGSFINDLDDEQNRAIYTSCNSTGSGWAGENHSAWAWATYLSLDELASYADTNPDDDRVSLDEVYSYSRWLVRDYWDLDQDP